MIAELLQAIHCHNLHGKLKGKISRKEKAKTQIDILQDNMKYSKWTKP